MARVGDRVAFGIFLALSACTVTALGLTSSARSARKRGVMPVVSAHDSVDFDAKMKSLNTKKP